MAKQSAPNQDGITAESQPGEGDCSELAQDADDGRATRPTDERRVRSLGGTLRSIKPCHWHTHAKSSLLARGWLKNSISMNISIHDPGEASISDVRPLPPDSILMKNLTLCIPQRPRNGREFLGVSLEREGSALVAIRIFPS